MRPVADSLSLSLNFNFDEAGIMTAYAPLTLSGGLAVTDGWWVKFATAPLNFEISDNNDDVYWTGLESTFSLNLDSTFNYDDVTTKATGTARCGATSPRTSAMQRRS